MSFTSVALQMVTVSLPILLGWCISKLGFMKAEFERELSRLLLQVALPCLVLSSALGDDVQLPSAADTFSLMGLSTAMYVVAIVIAFAVTAALRVPKGTECSYRFAVLFGNAGFIGFPVIQAVLGKQALLYASIALIPPTYLCLPSVSCSLVVHRVVLRSSCETLLLVAKIPVSSRALLCS